MNNPDFLIKDEGDFALLYPMNTKAMAYAKEQKTATWYSEKSIAIDIRSRRAVTNLLLTQGFTVEDC